MTFGFGFGFPRIQGVGAFSPASLFASGEVGVWYDPSDLTTMFQDVAGTTPVTTPSQTVALLLDKSQGLVLGPQLVTNGDFSNGITGWQAFSGATTIADVSQTLQQTVASGTAAASRPVSGFATVVGRTYRLSYDVVEVGAGATNAKCYVGTTSGGTTNGVEGTPRSTAGSVTTHFLAAATTYFLTTEHQGAVGTFTRFDNISVRELPGNHATQATAASRPTYGIVPYTGRRNLLLWTEDFTNAVWTKTNITLTSGIVDPNGGTAAFTFTASAANGTVSRNVGSLAAGSAISFWIRRRTGTGAVAMWDGNSYNDVTVTGSWARVQINQDILTTGFWDMRLAVSGDAVDVAFPQVETGSTATAYQRVTTQWDVTEAGVQSLSYLGFDGVDDGMLTGTITPSTDKAQVFAGVRKLSDANSAIVVELSTDVSGSNGTFYLAAPENFAIYYASLSRGNFPIGASQRADISTGAAPDTAVVSATHDISGNLSTMRRNTIAGINGTGFKGTGNFLAYPLYIGRRGGTTLPFSGNIYGLITRFSATNMDAANITSTETWLNQRTGAY